MTTKEAIDKLKGLYLLLSSDGKISKVGESVGMAIEALEKAEKYKWHDLRKNPNDLPKEDVYVNIFCGYRNTYVSARHSFVVHDGWVWTNEASYFSDVIAWKYIEPFDEVSE